MSSVSAHDMGHGVTKVVEDWKRLKPALQKYRPQAMSACVDTDTRAAKSLRREQVGDIVSDVAEPRSVDRIPGHDFEPVPRRRLTVAGEVIWRFGADTDVLEKISAHPDLANHLFVTRHGLVEREVSASNPRLIRMEEQLAPHLH
jgi:hypothetical protein